jgi:transmembrane sensor
MTISTGNAPAVTDEMLEAAMLWRHRIDSGEWSVDDEASFEIWLQADKRHSLAYEEIRELCGFIDQHAASPELIGARKEVLASVHRRARRRWTGPAVVLRAPTRRAIAAVLVAGLVGSAGAWALVARGDVYQTDRGERRSVILDDGSVLSLDAMSKVAVRYTKAERRLTLERGQARFDVAHDASRPFSVTARDRQIIATGTAFNVDMLAPEVRVTLIEGRVIVLQQSQGPLRPAPSGSKAVALRAGQSLVAKENGGATKVASADLAQATAWQQGQLVFNDEPLAQAVERINRYTSQKIAVADDTVGAITVSGTFNAGDIDAFVESVNNFLPVHAVTGPDGLILELDQTPG